MLTNLNRTQSRDAIAKREEFVNSTHSLMGVRGGVTGMGMLNLTERSRYAEDVPYIDFTVISYDTPIAWHTDKGWYKVEQNFSVTTSRHWGMVPAK